MTVGGSNNNLMWLDGASLMLSWDYYTYSRHLLERRRSVIGDILQCRLANRIDSRLNKPSDKTKG
ncbi:hypothetical protein VCR31J2_1360334 [Vibrio coralliirubri]|uniref:Uncharacterized protein n=1 Tax=Vibrio coralliirubri TaxID=1516159 RepID=A0AA87C2P7_9VIBR|nr:hypothetical protein VCR31J2_1360334 [Vibrio coralliirubri]